MEESELIKQAQSGNKKALEQLVKNYENTVYIFSFKIKNGLRIQCRKHFSVY
jgi:hypothetical protein